MAKSSHEGLRERKTAASTNGTADTTADSSSSMFLSRRAHSSPTVVNPFVANELRHATADAVKQILVDDFGFVEDHTISNVQLILGYVSSISIIAGSLYNFLVPFHQSMNLLLVSMAIYVVLNTALSAYNLLFAKDIMFVGVRKDHTGAGPDIHLVIRSKFEKYSETYLLKFGVSKFKKGHPQAKSGPVAESILEKPYSAWFDVDGKLVPKRLYEDIARVASRNQLHLS
ncbi:Signal peptidase complex subunit 2 [Batrachochytrium dendrobatidis]|nr:Signal peptidase complex subunit 2 [Batrachochytrium dendrobatidis]KAK5671619.1 Signal peptidase complex subunit 2 [Batrachochytrium dendrobatidis]